MTWCSGLEEICRADVPLSAHTWYRLGGPARWWVTPRDVAELQRVTARLRDANVPWRILGRGANVLVRDAGFDGAVIHLSAGSFSEVRYDGIRGYAGAGADFPKLVKDACNRGLAGLETLAGIPGMLGGIIRMNAGGKYGDISRVVRAVRVVDSGGALVEKTHDQVQFAYRRTRLDGCVVVGAVLELREHAAAELVDRYRQVWNEKYATQPPVSERSAGCVFKNPPGQSAGRLLDQAGLKGVRAGGARISEKHANFIVADPQATAAHVLELIEIAKDRVFREFGVELQLEVEVW